MGFEPTTASSQSWYSTRLSYAPFSSCNLPASTHYATHSQIIMRSELVNRALVKVTSPQILINVISKRVRQLGLGYRPMISVSPRMTFMDVALHEVADGKLSYEVIGTPAETAAKKVAKTRAKKSA